MSSQSVPCPTCSPFLMTSPPHPTSVGPTYSTRASSSSHPERTSLTSSMICCSQNHRGMAATRASSTNGAAPTGTGLVLPTTQHQPQHTRSYLLLSPTSLSHLHARYAPAYERFGSQIKAIHFIGPNKPWNSIPYRTPNSRRQQDSSDSPQRVYDYASLVDRWFDVYDRHYNSQAITPQASFQVNHYVPAWDQPPASALPVSTPVGALNLDDLKRLAVEGLPATISDVHPGEGSYQSLPLQGRVDLMRPRKEPEVLTQPETEKQRKDFDAQLPEEPERSDYFNYDNYEEMLSTPVARHAEIGGSQTRWHTLPTPGPHEIPSSPRLRRISLPSTPSGLPLFPTPTPDFYASESEHESLLLSHGDSEHNERHHGSPTHGHHHRQPQYDEQQHSQFHPGGNHEHHHAHHRLQHQEELARPRSPPMLSWNPAIEPPPNTTPTPNAFPSDTYFSNVWDLTPSRENDQTHDGPAPPDSGGFFQPPVASVIPESLVKQGHYRNVTGELMSGNSPSPDKKRVKPVFPWEAGPRAMPTRVFPDSDAPPPSLFLSPDSQSQTSATSPSTPETRSTAHAQALSPLYGLPTTFIYSNAWDSIPSIQQYASRLVKPPQPVVLPPALAPAFEEDAYRKTHKKPWGERTERSSRDGDDEDNADDEDEDGPAASSSVQWDDDSDGESAKRRSRRGSVVTASALLKGSKKEYRNRGVQTSVVETRSMAVQADLSQAPPRQDKPAKRPSVTLRKHWIPTVGAGVVAPMTTTKDINLGEPLFVNTVSPLQQQRQEHKPRTKSDSSSHSSSTPRSPVRSSREFIALAPRTAHKSVSPPTRPTLRSPPSLSSFPIGPNKGYTAPTAPEQRSASAIAATPTATSPGDALTSMLHNERFSSTADRPPPLPLSIAPAAHKKRAADVRLSPASIARKASNESSLGSPASSIGPLSPADGHALLLSPTRKGTRVWDPARGVDVFKRGSEEVLARFLKMGSWEEEAR